MKNLSNAEKRSNARQDYISGMKYKEISERYDVPINTIKSWKARDKWMRLCTPKKEGIKRDSKTTFQNKRRTIKNDLIYQLKNQKTNTPLSLDMVDDYMEMWEIKNKLIEDIKVCGVKIKWNNGKQQGFKENPSVKELLKVNAQMMKILTEFNLKPPPDSDDDDEEV